MLNSGKKIILYLLCCPKTNCSTKQKNIPPLQVKWSVPKDRCVRFFRYEDNA